MPENENLQELGLEEYKYGFSDEEKHVFRTQPGLTEEVVRQISGMKDEPEWMLAFRLKALEIYNAKPMPTWGGDLSDLDRVLDDIYFYVRPQDKMEHSWEDVPENIPPELLFYAHYYLGARALIDGRDDDARRLFRS